MAEIDDKPKASAGSALAEEEAKKIDWEKLPNKTGYGETWKNDLRDLIVQLLKNSKKTEPRKNPNDDHLPYTLE